jgi:L-alanine-DL-glutamate epimerase-like enolase superfamily enzyme
MRTVTASIERWETARPFVIARGVKNHVDVVVATIALGQHHGRGEATPIYYRGETAQSAHAAIEAVAPAVAAGADRAMLAQLLPAGAARNALDAALWDLEAKVTGRPVWRHLACRSPRPLVSAYTLSLDAPGAMAQAAAQAVAAGYPLLKLKLGGEGDCDRVGAVRAAAPQARLIADANESWAGLDIDRMCRQLALLGVELVEQPLPAAADADLAHLRPAVPLAADESCHDRSDLDRVVARYQAINVKLDKCGGLTEGLALADEARARGLGVMTGCMLSTSLGIAPAFPLAARYAHADLDGPLLLAHDRPGGVRVEGGRICPPEVALWG